MLIRNGKGYFVADKNSTRALILWNRRGHTSVPVPVQVVIPVPAYPAARGLDES